MASPPARPLATELLNPKMFTHQKDCLNKQEEKRTISSPVVLKVYYLVFTQKRTGKWMASDSFYLDLHVPL